MTTAQTEGVLETLIKYKVDQGRKGNTNLSYKLSEEQTQDMKECLISGEVPEEFLGIKLL